jgi:hypothetical protein
MKKIVRRVEIERNSEEEGGWRRQTFGKMVETANCSPKTAVKSFKFSTAAFLIEETVSTNHP